MEDNKENEGPEKEADGVNGCDHEGPEKEADGEDGCDPIDKATRAQQADDGDSPSLFSGSETEQTSSLVIK